MVKVTARSFSLYLSGAWPTSQRLGPTLPATLPHSATVGFAVDHIRKSLPEKSLEPPLLISFVAREMANIPAVK